VAASVSHCLSGASKGVLHDFMAIGLAAYGITERALFLMLHRALTSLMSTNIHCNHSRRCR